MRQDRLKVVVLMALLALIVAPIACGGGGGGGSSSNPVTYSGSTDPAVADSTNASGIAEYGMGSLEAGFPLAGAFVSLPNGHQRPVPQAQSLAVAPLGVSFSYAYTTSVTIPVPPEAVMSGSDYAQLGAGTMDLEGSLTLYMSNPDSANAETWYVDYGVLDGSVVFDGFKVEDDGPSMSGTVIVSHGGFAFSNSAQFSWAQQSIMGDPGAVMWDEVEMTFDRIDLSQGDDSWSLGEGDWVLYIYADNDVELLIYSMTVGYQGTVYKLENTSVRVSRGLVRIPAPAAVQPLGSISTNIQVSGVGGSYGMFYHPQFGRTYFHGNLSENSDTGDLIGGSLTFRDAAVEISPPIMFGVFFAYDPGYGATAYKIDVPGDSYVEYGYLIDGTFTVDPDAAVNFSIQT